jgi:hypothetical protein
LDRWIDDCGNSGWVAECLGESVEAFRQAFGASPRIMRFGNYWLSTDAINQAETLGVLYDLTLEPGRKSIVSADRQLQSGPTPDLSSVPRVPYVPSRNDFGIPETYGNRRNIWMIPLTSAYLSPGWGPAGLKHRVVRLMRNGIRDRFQSVPLQMASQWQGANSFSCMLDRAIETQTRPYLAFAIRSYLNGADFSFTDSSLHALLNHSARSRFRFCTPDEAMGIIAPEPL